jgi:DNA-binding transcriptional LysR family regulator
MFTELSHLLLIVEHGTFTAAARAAHLSQPALSASVQRLEAELGARLLERGRHGARLTAAGAALLPRARAALAALDDGRRAVAEVVGLVAGEVRLGGGPTACTWLLPARLATFRQRHPGVVLHLQEDHTPSLRRLVADGALDLAIVTGEGDDAWCDDTLVLVAPAGHPLAEVARRFSAKNINESEMLSAMVGVDFIAFAAESPTRGALDAAFPEARVVMALSSIGAVVGNVRAGIGVALVPQAAVLEELAAGHLVRVPHPRTPIPRLLSLVHRGESGLAPAAAALRALLLSDRP